MTRNRYLFLYLLTSFLLTNLMLQAQPNCNVFKSSGDTLQFKACILSEKLDHEYQLDMKNIEILDSCIQICPYYAFAYYEKGIVYLKVGNFVEWSKNVDQAVKYDPISYLGLRGCTRAKTFADYEGAINDIESLDSILDYDIGYVNDGVYHLNSYKALCYKELGNFQKAVEIFEARHSSMGDEEVLYDYLHLGICYQKLNQHKDAIRCFEAQEQTNNLAENNFYASLSYKELGDLKNYKKSLSKSKEMLLLNQKMKDIYHVMEDEIFLSDILNEEKSNERNN